MNLISILIALALEYFLGSLDHIRNFDWFDRYSSVLELRFSRYRYWDSPAGVIFTLLWPVLILLGVAYLLASVTVILVFVLGIAVFVYCLGPDINNLLHRYSDTVREDKDEDRQRLEEALDVDSVADSFNEEAALESMLFRSHEHIFAILFWFLLLPIIGALLYRLVVRLERSYGGIHGGYAEAVRNLHRIMMWPSARLLALSFGLSGSMMHALESWRAVTGHSLDCSAAVISHSGMGALQYEPAHDGEEETDDDRYAGWIDEIRGLINRTLIVWLTGLGIMTIGGFLR